jgi:hypothetical protein
MADNKVMTPLKTALVGAAVGAAAVMLSKKENRDKLGKTVKKVLNQGEQKLNKAIEEAKKTSESLTRDVERETKKRV